jgi:hypothetical protein
MFIGRMLYWLLTGALIGFGVIAILSLGFPFLLLGLLLVGFGGLPPVILVWDVTSAPWACASGDALPNVKYYSCVDTVFGTLTTFHVLAFGFGVIALVGLAWPLLSRLLMRAHRVAA